MEEEGRGPAVLSAERAFVSPPTKPATFGQQKERKPRQAGGESLQFLEEDAVAISEFFFSCKT